MSILCVPIKCGYSLDLKPADGKTPTLKDRSLSSVGENPVSRALISDSELSVRRYRGVSVRLLTVGAD